MKNEGKRSVLLIYPRPQATLNVGTPCEPRETHRLLCEVTRPDGTWVAGSVARASRYGSARVCEDAQLLASLE